MVISNNQNGKLTPYKVLLVEENSTEIELYSDLIRNVAHCKIDVITEAWDSIQWIDRLSYHLVILSISGPSLKLLEQIKRLNPSTGVIIITSQSSVEEAVAAIRMGAEDYLSKPFKVDAFQLAIKRALDRKLVLGENSRVSSFLHLLSSCQMISGSLEQSKIFEIIQSYLLRELKASYSSIYSVHNNELIRVDGLERDEFADRNLEEILDITLRASGAIFSLQDSNTFYKFTDRGQLTPAIFVFRFQCAGQSDYYCACLSPESPKASDTFEGQLRMLKAQIEVTGKNIEHYLGVQKLVYVDDATGLYNTRYLNYILDREISQAKQSGRSFAVLFMDADRFKQVNDTHGHLNGTRLLNELGNHLKKHVRERDTVFRYGGDEFVAILSACDLETAKVLAEKIRASVEKKSFLKTEGLDIHFTVSIGVALFPDHAGTKKEIIQAADQAMYDAKKTTRNSVSITQIKVKSGSPKR
jgi:diguanylate cyclase (GGDEF)-like protein